MELTEDKVKVLVHEHSELCEKERLIPIRELLSEIKEDTTVLKANMKILSFIGGTLSTALIGTIIALIVK